VADRCEADIWIVGG